MMIFRTKAVRELIRSHGLDEGGAVQCYIDSSVLRYCDPYVPKDTGMLIRSGTIHTVIGSGCVKYKTPYARQNYYCNAGRGRNGLQHGGLRGRLWFERMKADKKEIILNGARKIAERSSNG